MKKAKKILASVRQAGFTMVELLIVIAILGILTVAVLSAINPIEQINRGRDTGSRSDAEQVIGAIDRFYTSHGYYPWAEDVMDETLATEDTVGTLHDDGMLMLFDDTWLQNVVACPVMDLLSAGTVACPGSNELKETFMNKIGRESTNALYVYNGGGRGDSTYVCSSPRSSAFLIEAQERCTDGLPEDITDAEGVICPADVDDTLTCLP
jgi:prepilin-type N-terminal cleavage/methylation domain-containing protein